jgi:hypothetical protein
MDPSPARGRANFFLVGAPKAGTTSLARQLAEHPDVFLSPIKEPCHFCTDVREQLAPAFERQHHMDLAAYLDAPVRPPVHFHLVASAVDYARLYEGAADYVWRGECSTHYLSSRDAPRNLHAYAPDARIVVMLRDPLQRIRSHYAMERSQGKTLRPLLKLVEEERALGRAAHWGNSHYYLGATRYLPQLQRYLQHFPADQICVLSFEQLIADPPAVLRRLYAFMGLPAPAAEHTLPTANRARAPRFPLANRLLRASGLRPWVGRVLRQHLPARAQDRLAATFYRHGAPDIPEEALVRLEALIRDEGLREDWTKALAHVRDA